MRKLYRLPEVLELLSISRTQAYREMEAGRLAFVQRGRHRVFEPEAIDAFVAALRSEVPDDLGQLLALVDDDGRLSVDLVPDDCPVSLEALKRAVADRQAVA